MPFIVDQQKSTASEKGLSLFVREKHPFWGLAETGIAGRFDLPAVGGSLPAVDDILPAVMALLPAVLGALPALSKKTL